MEILRQIQDDELPENPYLPYIAAVEHRLVNPDELVPQVLELPLGVMLANGQIPADSAGSMKLAGELHVFDHLSLIDMGPDKIFFGPSSKEDVTSEGELRDSGLFVITKPSGILRIVGFAISVEVNPWLAAEGKLGKLGITQLGLDSIDTEPIDIDRDGIVEADIIFGRR